MDIREKRVLTNMTYYALLGIAFALCGLFAWAVASFDVPMWAMIIYYVWIAVAIGVLVLDIICTITKGSKFIAGIIMYCLVLSAVAMAVVLYFVLAGTGRMPADVVGMYEVMMALSGSISLFLIATFLVGEWNIQYDLDLEEM